MLDRFNAGHGISSTFMTRAQERELNTWLEGAVRVVPPHRKAWESQISFLFKRTEGDVTDGPASTTKATSRGKAPTDMIKRLGIQEQVVVRRLGAMHLVK